MTRIVKVNAAWAALAALFVVACGSEEEAPEAATAAEETVVAETQSAPATKDEAPAAAEAAKPAAAAAPAKPKNTLPADVLAALSDPFVGIAPEVLAEKLAVKLDGQRLGIPTASLLSALTSSPVDTVDVEIRGVRLGMTLEEARAALLANMPEGSTFEVNQMGTVAHIISEVPIGMLTPDSEGAYPVKATGSDPMVSKEEIIIEFAVPPAKSVVRSITRKHPMEFATNFQDNQTSVEVYHQALIGKYGTPAQDRPLYGGAVLKWLFDADEVDCTSSRGSGAAHPYNWVFQYAGDPGDCSTALVYSYNAGSDGIVRSVEARLANVGHMHLNNLANKALMEALTEEVNAAKRESATDTPDL